MVCFRRELPLCQVESKVSHHCVDCIVHVCALYKGGEVLASKLGKARIGAEQSAQFSS